MLENACLAGVGIDPALAALATVAQAALVQGAFIRQRLRTPLLSIARQ